MSRRHGSWDWRVDRWQVDRRQFLKLTALTVAGGIATERIVAASRMPIGSAVDGESAVLPTVGTSFSELARSLEFDPQRIFRFVADEVRYEPYAGVLRGATGTLWARAGNSADQAMLLAALLAESLVPYHFVTGAIDAPTAQSLLDGASVDPQTAAEQARAVLLGGADLPAPEASPLPGSSPSAAPSVPPGSSPAPAVDVPTFLADRRAAAPALVSTATAQLQAGISTVVDALAGSGITLPGSVSGVPALERSQHVWVQSAFGPGWLDMDPTRPGAAAGATLATAGAPLATLPDELRHQLLFEVVAESVSNGQLTQQVIMEHVIYADTLVGVPVTFLNAKPDGLAALGFGIAGALEGTIQYVPALAVGSESFVGRTPITFGNGGGLSGVFGTPGSNEGETTAEWLEIHVLSLETGSVVARREIFDRVGAKARASGTFDPTTLAPAVFVDLGPDAPMEFPPCRTVLSFAVSGGIVNGGFFAQEYDSNDAFANASVVGHLYHYVRDALAAQLALGQGARPFCNAPNITAYTLVPGQPVGDTLPVTAGMDIWTRSFGFEAMQGAAPTGSPAVLAGVLAHVAERIAIGETQPADPSQPTTAHVSVGRLFEAASAQGIATQLLRGASLPAGQPYGAAAASLMNQRLAQGLVLVAPERPVDLDGTPRVGWWLVDPLTGWTSDELDDGGGEETGEYSIPLTAEGKAVGFFQRMALCASTYAAAASLLLGAGSNYDPSTSLSTILSIASGIASQIANLPSVPGC